MVAAISSRRRCSGSWRSKRGLAAPARVLCVVLTRRDVGRGSLRGAVASCDPPQAAVAEGTEDLARGVVSGSPGYAATRMRAGAAHVQALQRPAVVAVAEHRARGEQLIEAEGAVEDVAAGQAEGALEVERTHDLTSEHGGLEIRGV